MDDNVFLETTIQIDRNFTEKQRVIDENLRGKVLSTSNYVLGEYNGNILREATTLYNLLQQSESTKEALSRLNEICHSDRQYDRVMKIFSSIFDDEDMSIDNVKKRLDLLIEVIITARFRRGISKFVDLTGCQRSRAYPVKIDGTWKMENLSCRQSPRPKCEIVEFINKNRLLFKSICRITEENLAEIVATITTCLADQTRPYGRNCQKMGDAIIACEVPGSHKIYTTNIKDYSPICRVIGKELFE